MRVCKAVFPTAMPERLLTIRISLMDYFPGEAIIERSSVSGIGSDPWLGDHNLSSNPDNSG